MAPTAGRFAADDLERAAGLIGDVLKAEGTWCNLAFEPIEDDDVPQDSALFGFLAARGPSNPLATVMPAGVGKRPNPPQVGIQHRAGTKAASQLRDESLVLPEGSRVAQDHPRRGLVVEWPQPVDVSSLVAWLFPAMRVLGRAPTTNDVLYEWHGV